MELKWWWYLLLWSWEWVLIVPLWNWNEDGKLHLQAGRYCSNRTFMELKSRNNRSGTRPLCSSNRTFMELKFASQNAVDHQNAVLIVPLWNWNWPIAYGERSLYCVLIVPLWNWYGKYHRCIANSPDKKSELSLAGADSLYFPQSLEVQCPLVLHLYNLSSSTGKNSA